MEITVDLSKPEVPCLRADRDYAELCKIDAQIRDRMRDQLEALPAVIHLIEEELVWPKRLRRQLCRRLGIVSDNGPFYEDHYLDNGVRKVFAGAA